MGNGIIGKIAGDMAESTRNVREINRENMAAIKADSKALFEEAKTPDPGLVKVRDAKGLGNKVSAIVENIKDGAAVNAEQERARRAEIQSHESYRTLLEGQRAGMQPGIKSVKVNY